MDGSVPAAIPWVEESLELFQSSRGVVEPHDSVVVLRASRPQAGEEAGMRRFLAGLPAVTAPLIATTPPAAAYAGLIAPNGAGNFVRTPMSARYHRGLARHVVPLP